eukprot:CAMPEP_0114498670 /NCGR_PEP_ID=MMETSP0109-20121206/6997_1 /TAXON_ID=29199 /ORGANISM="Chlorarachnion reptans, Strain CCCM449" /LENGTH=393 /DNA_ID=CAMNT_0001676165 /DNA_START=137 /DNA_END=1318 /DNA_ORIENTATION=+
MIYDENDNANNAKRSRYSTRSKTAKMGLRNGSSRRTALGDISNARNDWKSGKGLKKPKAVLGGDTRKASKPPTSRRARVMTRSSKKTASSRAKPESVQDSIQGVADLHLSSMDVEEEEEKPTLCSVDLRNLTNPQMCVEYVQEIMQYLKSIEGKFRAKKNYMSKQRDINSRMREILIDWLNEVHLKFKLRIETLYLSINLIDRFLSLRAVSRTKLQLVGCTAMLIASKYEEIYAPEVRDFVYISDNAYDRDQIIGMESAMLSALKFDLTVAYPLRFLERFVQLCDLDDQFKHLANFLCEMTLQKIEFLDFLPSMIAASATSLALKMDDKPSWNELLERESGFSEQSLLDCKLAMQQLLLDPKPKYTAVRKKYSLEKFGEVTQNAKNRALDIEL